jgi:hypothetical protein
MCPREFKQRVIIDPSVCPRQFKQREIIDPSVCPRQFKQRVIIDPSVCSREFKHLSISIEKQLSEKFLNIFNTFLAAFRSGYGCQSTLLHILEDWKKGLDNDEYLSFMCMLCRSLFVRLYFFWPLCCLFFFDIRILITPLVFSNSS